MRLPIDQFDRNTSPKGVVNFGHCIRFPEQTRNHIWRGGRFDFGSVAYVRGGETDPWELRASFDLSGGNRDTQASRLTKDIVAVAGCESQHQELATVAR